MQEAVKKKSLLFEVPLGRVQLAEYLSANRSALTQELKAMQEDGFIEYDENTFRILKSLE